MTVRFWLIGALILLEASSASCASADRHIGLPPGDFFWEPELAPNGPLVLIISLPDQTLAAYRNGIRIAYSSISSGVKRRSTPTGVFTILEKEVTHFSNKYHHAPMPFMQRLTWEGVALHGGDLPGYPASHGCIRLPREFAKKLYSLTVRGTTVIVVDEKHPQPTVGAHSGIIFTDNNSQTDVTRSLEGEFAWSPERSAEGPVTILASGADGIVYVYRNGIEIGRAGIRIDSPEEPLGGHAFTMLEGLAETASAFVPGRRGPSLDGGPDRGRGNSRRSWTARAGCTSVRRKSLRHRLTRNDNRCHRCPGAAPVALGTFGFPDGIG